MNAQRDATTADAGHGSPAASLPLRVPIAIALLIVYGSLWPFNFRMPADVDGWALRLFTDTKLRTSFSDELGNVGLFVPFGIAAVWSLDRRANRWIAAVSTLVVSFALAFVLQVAQQFVPGRVAAMADVVWNAAGAAMGIAAGLVLQRVLPARYVYFNVHGSVVLGLLGLWGIQHFAPFVPGLDFGDIKNGLKPLLLYPQFSPVEISYTTAQTLLVARLVDVAVGHARALRLLPALVPAAWIVRLLVGRGIGVTHVVGMTAGIAIWLGWNATRKRAVPSGLIFAVLFFAYTVWALSPFTLQATPSSFSWVPFETVLDGAMLNNLRNLAAAAFSLAGCVWLMHDAGWRARSAAIVLAGWAFLLEWAQRWLVDRTPSVTETVVVLLAGVAIGHSSRFAAAGAAPAVDWRRPTSAELPPTTRHPAVLMLTVAAAIVGLAVGLQALLRLPGVPYNLSSLLLDDGGMAASVVFAMALLWIGAGPALLGGWMARSRYPYLVLPVGLILLALVSRTLLKYSVTYESLDDILGSNVYAGELAGWVERRVRFLALYSPLATLLTLAYVASRPGRDRVLNRSRARWAVVAAIAGVWLWVSKLVVIDWAGTDNLTELIASQTAFVTSGVLFLFLTAALLSVNAVALFAASRGAVSRAVALTLTIAAIPVGWMLLGIGLEGNVSKYGHVFPAVQFLLGPDRQQSLGDVMLFARWSILYVGALTVLACGTWFGDAASRQIR